MVDVNTFVLENGIEYTEDLIANMDVKKSYFFIYIFIIIIVVVFAYLYIKSKNIKNKNRRLKKRIAR